MQVQQPPQAGVHTSRKKLASRTKLALWLMIGPTALFAIALTLLALTNLIFNPTFWPTPDTEDFAATPIGITIVNVLLFTVGAIAALAWLPGIITGAVLLAKKPKEH